MSNSLSQKFNVYKLIKFALPTTLMMVFLSVYVMVDGIFIANFVNEAAFTSINIVYPFIGLSVAVGTMISSGASAIVSRNLGEGKVEEARENFTLMTLIGGFVGLLLGVIGYFFASDIATMLGSTPVLDEYCYEYLSVLSLFSPLLVMQILSQIFFVVAGRPSLGLIYGVGGGAINIVLDYVFIVLFDMGVTGAAVATGLGYSLPAFAFLLFFVFKGKKVLFFAMPKVRGSVILSTCTNGSSELVTNLSFTVTTLLFNFTVLRLVGEVGVAAVGIVLYGQFLLMSAFLGYSQGVAPIFGFSYGAENFEQLKRVFNISLCVIGVTSVLMYLISLFCADFLIGLFVREESRVFVLAQYGFKLFSFSFIFMGINVFASAMFTALSNGFVSATVSFLRTFFFIVLFVWILPKFWGLDGVWLAIPFAEFCTLFVSFYFLYVKRKVYRY